MVSGPQTEGGACWTLTNLVLYRVRVLINVFGTIVSPKFRRKVVHVNSLSALALNIPIEKLLIPPSAYLQDRRDSPDIYAPFVTGKRAFAVCEPLPKNASTGKTRLPRVLREATTFLLMPPIVKTEGIFRIPPHSVLTSVLKEAYDRGQQWIVWKEPGATFSPPGMPLSLVEEIRYEDAYGVHLAASLIKTWYRELREPIFPESSYAALREKYNHSDMLVTPEDLVDLILPASTESPLSPIAREILTRHLLPLLSTVASHEADNKMNPENLAICFSMCLVCGTNQMDDAKVSSIVKRILQAAIEMWPQLRTGLGLAEESFLADLEPPTDPWEYEDPLEKVRPRLRRLSGDDDKGEIRDSSDGSDSASEQRPPALPPRRRSRGQSLKAALAPHLPNVELTKLPKRKPAPHPPSPYSDHDPVSDPVMSGEPPRYSSIFPRVARSESPGSYMQVPADGFAPARSSNDSSFDMLGGDKKQIPLPDQSTQVPKRKPVVSRQSSAKGEQTSSSSTTSSMETTNALLVEMQARLDQKNTVNTSCPPSSISNDGDEVFRKPSWPASANRQGPNIQSLARPVVPARKSNTLPMPSSATLDGSSNSLSAPQFPKPRTPSPGLLNRMSSWENRGSPDSIASGSGLQPKKLELKKSSVDDLRRLCEERSMTAKELASIGRRASSNH